MCVCVCACVCVCKHSMATISVAPGQGHCPPTSSSSSSSSAVRRLCLVCTRQKSKYTCPRCNVPYCSVDCYKQHGVQCTEQFFQQNVMDELKVQGQSEEDRRKMVQILRRQAGLQEGESDDEGNPAGWSPFEGSQPGCGMGPINSDNLEGEGEEFDDNEGDEESQAESQMLAERLEALALKPDIDLDDLDEHERERFLRAALGGHLSAHIDVWKPWWVLAEEKSSRLIQVVGETSDGAEVANSTTVVDVAADTAAAGKQGSQDFPTSDTCACGEGDFLIRDFPLPVVPMNELCPLRRSFPEQLRPNLIDVLCAYACTLRLYNGDMDNADPVGATLSLIEHSGVFSCDARYTNFDAAIDGFRVRQRGGSLLGDVASRPANALRTEEDAALLRVLNDVALLLASHHHVQRAVTELYKYLHRTVALLDMWIRQSKSRSKLEKSSEAAQTKPASGSDQSGTELGLCVATAIDQEMSDAEAGRINLYMQRWTAHLRLCAGHQPANRPRRAVLKQHRKLLSKLRRKAHFFASWVQTIAPGQLRAIRTHFHESFDSRRKDAKAAQSLLSAKSMEMPALLDAGRNAVVAPKNFSICHEPLIMDVKC